LETEPGENEKIVGFHGVSGRHGMCWKFGILTAPKDAELPRSAYEMQELQNLAEGRPNKRRKMRHDEVCCRLSASDDLR